MLLSLKDVLLSSSSYQCLLSTLSNSYIGSTMGAQDRQRDIVMYNLHSTWYHPLKKENNRTLILSLTLIHTQGTHGQNLMVKIIMTKVIINKHETDQNISQRKVSSLNSCLGKNVSELKVTFEIINTFAVKRLPFINCILIIIIIIIIIQVSPSRVCLVS